MLRDQLRRFPVRQIRNRRLGVKLLPWSRSYTCSSVEKCGPIGDRAHLRSAIWKIMPCLEPEPNLEPKRIVWIRSFCLWTDCVKSLQGDMKIQIWCWSDSHISCKLACSCEAAHVVYLTRINTKTQTEHNCVVHLQLIKHKFHSTIYEHYVQYTDGDAPMVMHRLWCTDGDAPMVIHR